MSALKIRGMILGEGRAKVCVPIAEESKEAILAAAERAAISGADCIEWRMDCYRGDLSGPPAEREEPEIFAGIAGRIRERIGETPLLMTMRSKGQGGGRLLSPKALLCFQEKLITLLPEGSADILDIEDPSFQAEREKGTILAQEAKQKDIRLLISRHFFEAMPSKEKIRQYLEKAHESEADIIKLAVLPQNLEDLSLLEREAGKFRREKGKKPMIIVAMSDLGKISRIRPERFCSDLTFACLGKPSAPGQVEFSELKTLLYSQNRAYDIIRKEKFGQE